MRSPVLEIGLNGLLLDYPHSGTAVYTRNLLAHLPEVAPEFRFRAFVRQPRSAGPRGITIRNPLPIPGHAGAQINKFLWETASLPLASALRGQSLLHSLYFAAPPVTASPLVVTIHDLIPLLLPGYHRSRLNSLYSRFMAFSCRHAAAIITVSEHSKRDIVRLLGVPADRVWVTPEAAGERFHPGPYSPAVRARYGLPERFVLYTGGAERRKNIETLVRAWHRVRPAMRSAGVRLVIVARFPPPDRLYPDISGLVRELELADDVQLVPWVDDDDLPDLYRAALLFAFPSMYEGFGLTPMEAMASGLPVISSDASSLPEVVGDGAIILPPADVAAWADTLLALVCDAGERQALRERGLRRAREFSWRRTARETAAVYREVLACAS